MDSRSRVQKDIAVVPVSGLSVGMFVDIMHGTDQTKNEINKISAIIFLRLTMTTNLVNTYSTSTAIKMDGSFKSYKEKKIDLCKFFKYR
jgi:hypothetical protein